MNVTPEFTPLFALVWSQSPPEVHIWLFSCSMLPYVHPLLLFGATLGSYKCFFLKTAACCSHEPSCETTRTSWKKLPAGSSHCTFHIKHIEIFTSAALKCQKTVNTVFYSQKWCVKWLALPKIFNLNDINQGINNKLSHMFLWFMTINSVKSQSQLTNQLIKSLLQH